VNAPSPRPNPTPTPTRASAGAGAGPSTQPGVIGLALAAVLAAALAQGAWEWFSTYIGLTLLAAITAFYRPPAWVPGRMAVFWRELAAYSLVVGLSVSIIIAPAMQRWAWLFPMPGTRRMCGRVGSYASAHVAASGPDGRAVEYVRAIQRHTAATDCLAATTTRWLPVYGLAAALLTFLVAALVSRRRAKKRTE
jgi:hypothetical protein